MVEAAFLLVLIGIVYVVTRGLCHRALVQRRAPSGWLALAGAGLTAVIMVGIVFGGDLFSRRFWHDAKVPTAILVPVTLVFCWIASLLPALLVVWHGQRRAEREQGVPGR